MNDKTLNNLERLLDELKSTPVFVVKFLDGTTEEYVGEQRLQRMLQERDLTYQPKTGRIVRSELREGPPVVRAAKLVATVTKH